MTGGAAVLLVTLGAALTFTALAAVVAWVRRARKRRAFYVWLRAYLPDLRRRQAEPHPSETPCVAHTSARQRIMVHNRGMA